MNRLRLLFAFIIAGSAAAAQVPSSCTPTATFTTRYREDAKDMAVARLYNIGSPDTAVVEVADVYTDSIMAGLAAIYNSSTVESDSIFNNYCVHSTVHGFTRNTIRVEVDDSYPWVSAWASMHTTTGYTALDNFLSIHGYTLTDFYSYSWGKIAVLTTDHVLNSKAFADSLQHFDGIWTAQEGYQMGTGDYIHYSKGTGNQGYTFYAGWGDCPAGCTSYKTWVYEVDASCNVTLVSATRTGSEAYTEMPNCSSVNVGRVERTEAFRVYPNPIVETLTLENKASYWYSLSDAYGRVASEGKANGRKTLNLSDIAAGLYILNVTDEAGNVHTEKVIKQ